MIIKNLRIDTFTVGKAILSFETDVPVGSNYFFKILRGDGRGSDASLSGAALVGTTKTTRFTDETVVDIGLLRQSRYWIEVHKTVGVADVKEGTFGPFYPGSSIPSLAAEMVRLLEIYLKHGGTAFAVYTLMEQSKRCPKCWDDIKGAPTLTDCRDCHGTGISRPFGGPFVVRGMMNPPSEIKRPSPMGENESIQAQILMGPLPRVQPKDIVRSTDGKAWRVVSVTPTEYKQVLVQQFLNLSVLEKSDGVYDLSVPEEITSYNPTTEPRDRVLEVSL